MSENSLPESLTASSRGTSGLPVEGILLERSFADVVGAGDRPQCLRAATGRADRHETHVMHALVETPDWSPRSGDDVS